MIKGEGRRGNSFHRGAVKGQNLLRPKHGQIKSNEEAFLLVPLAVLETPLCRGLMQALLRGLMWYSGIRLPLYTGEARGLFLN